MRHHRHPTPRARHLRSTTTQGMSRSTSRPMSLAGPFPRRLRRQSRLRCRRLLARLDPPGGRRRRLLRCLHRRFPRYASGTRATIHCHGCGSKGGAVCNGIMRAGIIGQRRPFSVHGSVNGPNITFSANCSLVGNPSQTLVWCGIGLSPSGEMVSRGVSCAERCRLFVLELLR